MLDLDTCQGYANCVMVAPDVFDIDEQKGTAILLQEQPDDSRLAAVEEAVRQCPTEAISVEN
ncbi:MAG TPA: ferredoxin [Thermoleophilaceae bacterium]